MLFRDLLLQLILPYLNCVVFNVQVMQAFVNGSIWDCSGNCCDEHELCKLWSKRSECQRQLGNDSISKQCPQYCNLCPNERVVKIDLLLKGSDIREKQQQRIPRCFQPSTNEAIPRWITSTTTMNGACTRTNIPNPCFRDICFHQSYRTFDGSCNNFVNSLMGAAYTPYVRLLDPEYDDTVNAVTGSLHDSRPNARLVSRALLSTRRTISTNASSMLMQFGQFLSHDITKNKLVGKCTCTGGSECMAVSLSDRDRREKNSPCIPIKRSVPVCGTGIGNVPREQLNENTAFIDASGVYGSDAPSHTRFRVFRQANMQMVPIRGRSMLPLDGKNKFRTGDNRSNLFIGLSALHIVFIRFHNRLVARLRRLNTHWKEDRLFQESRKIVGALMQVITYLEFLPALLGPLYNVLIPQYSGYDPSVNPSISNEFAAAAYRLHGLIQEFYELRNSNFDLTGKVSFVESTFQIDHLMNGGIDDVIRGLVTQPARQPQRITAQVTELFGGGSIDLATINVMRGRDHGFQSYNHYRILCKLMPVDDFRNWTEVSNVEVRQRVKDLYGKPEFLDLYVGGTIEDPFPGSIVGPTFACLIAEQMVRLRDGDRFYFENPEQYSDEQRTALRRITLASILCETGDDMPMIAPNALRSAHNQTLVPCATLPKLDLHPWIEELS